MKRNFVNWKAVLKPSIASYDYYIDFQKVVENVEKHKVELNILNSLIGSKNIEKDFKSIIKKYPETLNCIPLLLAVRGYEIYAQDKDGAYLYIFFAPGNLPVEQYTEFMKKTGLFDMLENHLVNNLVDYAYGVETGLDSNGRKNRGGHLMEDLVENYIQKAGFKKDSTYFKEMYLEDIEKKWGLDLSPISGKGTSTKRFDFVVKGKNTIYGIETNFYTSSGSKLNETARSYELIANESKAIKGFKFVWITDGTGWYSAEGNLHNTFNALDDLYNIKDLEDGILRTALK